MTPPQIDALAELSLKSLVQIQTDTAVTWAYRAWAARTLCTRASSVADQMAWAHDATEYEHEALEHAALSGDDSLLAKVREIIATNIA